MFTLPDFNTSSSPYLEEIDAQDWSIQTQGHTQIGVLSGCAVTPSTLLTLTVASGVVLTSGLTFSPTGTTVTLAAADAALYRFDLVGCTSAGVVSVVQGTALVHPVFPTVPAGFVVYAAALVTPAVTTIPAAFIVDKRVFVTGFAQMKSGTATILQTTTTIPVTHGLAATPTRVQVTPTVSPTAFWWVSGKGTTNFTINLASAAPTGGVSFDWVAWVGDGS